MHATTLEPPVSEANTVRSDKLKGKKLFVKPVNCISARINLNKYEKFVLSNGCETTGNIKEADIIIVDTCGFSADSEKSSIASVKESESLAKEDAKIIVCGCLTSINPQKLQNQFKGEFFTPKDEKGLSKILKIDDEENKFAPSEDTVGRFVGIMPGKIAAQHKHRRIEYLFRINNKIKIDWIPGIGKIMGRRTAINPRGYSMNISQGCLGNCTFCVIPFARGTTRSLPMGLIVDKIRGKVQEGVKQFILNSEDTGAYGMDIGCTIVDLLEKIHEIEGDFKVYIHFFDPRWLRKYDASLRALFAKKKINHIQLPIQSGSNSVLNRMKRAYQMDHVLPLIREYRKSFPWMFITTEIITGFPGETKEEHSETVKVVQEGLFDHIRVFPFSNRPGAEAETMPDHLPQAIVEERADSLSLEWEKVKSRSRSKYNLLLNFFD